MIIPVAALVAILLPLALGGRPGRLAGIRLRHVGLIVGALAVQVVIVEIVPGPPGLLKAIHIGTYLLAAAFIVLNRQLPGLLVIGTGALSNGITIALNGGTLPARAGAMRLAGIGGADGAFVNSGHLDHPVLPWLGDVFAIPASWPLANVFSVGDVLIIGGLAITSWRILGTRWTAPFTPAQPAHEQQAPLAA
jgi:Family of unknown function (DUF5317)